MCHLGCSRAHTASAACATRKPGQKELGELGQLAAPSASRVTGSLGAVKGPVPPREERFFKMKTAFHSFIYLVTQLLLIYFSWTLVCQICTLICFSNRNIGFEPITCMTVTGYFFAHTYMYVHTSACTHPNSGGGCKVTDPPRSQIPPSPALGPGRLLTLSVVGFLCSNQGQCATRGRGRVAVWRARRTYCSRAERYKFPPAGVWLGCGL